MKIKGLEELRRHVPDLQTDGGFTRVILSFVAVILITSLFFLLVDTRFIEWLPDGEIVILALGLLIMTRFFSQKKAYQDKYGELAYRNAFAHFMLPGLGIVFASIAHLGYIAGPAIPDVSWRPIVILIGWILLLSGVSLWSHSVAAFGVDHLALLYVYFPAEDRLVDSSIYQIIRHPIYGALLDLGIGLALIHANWYGLVSAVLLPIFIIGWIRLVEEKELLERFPGFAEYRRQVPMFIPRPARLVGFFRFLILGK